VIFEPNDAAWTEIQLENRVPEAWEAMRRVSDEDTLLLALQSVQRWGNRYRVSPAMRLRAIRAVVTAALQSDGA
jgi:hypothetical protein